MTNRHLEIGRKVVNAGVKHLTLQHRAAQRVGAVKDHKGDSPFGRCFHGHSHSREIGIKPCSHVLHVEDEDVNGIQHFGRRYCHSAIEAINREVQFRVNHVAHLFTGGALATNAVLWGKESHQFHPWRFRKEVGCTPATRIYPRLIGDETYLFSFQQSVPLLLQDIDTEPYRRFLSLSERWENRHSGESRNPEHRFHWTPASAGG